MTTTFDVLTGLWNWRSPAWVLTLAAAGVYAVVGRRRHASLRQIGFFAASAIAFIIALASPVAGLATRYLFSAHMAQHLLLLLIVPLFAVLAWPAPARQSIAAAPQRAAIPLSWMAGVGAMWFWHIPAMCTASMVSPLVFEFQQVSLIAAGAAFWWPIFCPTVERRLQPLPAAGYLFSGCLGCTLLGIYITFSPVSVCPLYNSPTGSSEILHLIRDQWGFTHGVDQQVGGLLMWVPACMVYLAAILATLSSWYHVPGQSQQTSTSLAEG
jgi:putative membrane protein